MPKLPDNWGEQEDQVTRKRAAWDSRCAYCDEEIHEGDVIELLAEDQEWVHLECAELTKG